MSELEHAAAGQAPRRPPADAESGMTPVWIALFLAWLIAVAASLGAIFVGEIMGQAPCVLCWYQRAFMFPLAVVLAVGAFNADATVWRYGLPLACIGALIAAYHSLLYAGIIAEALKPCGQGPSCTDAGMTILGGVPLPYLSLAAFVAVSALLLPAMRAREK